MQLTLVYFMMLVKLVDFIFPKNCMFCDTQNTQFCYECKKSKIVYYDQQNCHVCHKLVKDSFIHKECANESNLSGVIVVAKYNKSAKLLIEEMKYNLYFSISVEIGNLMKKAMHKSKILYDVAIPVPLHRFKKNYRGFNQAELLAKIVSIKVDDCMKRTKNTKSQVSLNREARIENLKDVFEINKPINYKTVLLVDDVMTSGTTLEECAKVLKEAGVEKVYALVFARG